MNIPPNNPNVPDDQEKNDGLSVEQEVQRKYLHMVMIVVPLWIYFAPERWRLLGLIIATSLTVGLDILRLSDRRLKHFFLMLFRALIRRHEAEEPLGLTYFMFAALICELAFDTDIAVAALAFLVIGDMAAAVVGKRFGRIRFGDKSLEGSLACFLACVVVAQPLIGSWWVILAGSAAAAVAEAVPLPLDDNIRVPVFSGLVMQLVTNFIPG